MSTSITKANTAQAGPESGVVSVARLNDYDRDKYNVLVPVTTMTAVSNLQRIVVNEVRLDPNPSGADVYKELSSGKFAITKVGGMKLAAAANISVVSVEKGHTEACCRCIDMAKATGKAQPCGTCPNVHDLAVTVTLRVPEPSGGFRLVSASKEIYVAEIREDMKKTDQNGRVDEKQFRRFLPHRQSIAESKAFMRALRSALGLSAGYTLDELKKPFIVAHVAPNLDAPEIRERVASSYLQSMGLLFETPDKAALSASAPATVAALPAPEECEAADVSDDGLPWDSTESAAFVCQDCGATLTDITAKDGTVWSAVNIHDFSMDKFNLVLCPACQRKRSGGGQ